ncbi:N-acetylglucosamine-6-phosphate deacetylase [Chitinophaga caeni]|uniref:N-acetylglucosamine-6-phosphate deacetylase n=1 Tax=Chitinophaga caeni TaxID=2029983 RepID=A0A291QQN0_9BACT|nr:N-acetylglucosamine-6-phosphate deacetylase [Chitinophaga caeni]ATL46308.1 N-acetylglucosamine-6-phosphate deacetylase [Chitinophaga caeni]
MAIAYSNFIFSEEGNWQTGKALLCEQGKIVGWVNDKDIPTKYDTVDLRGAYLHPALIDLQIYAGNGKVFLQNPNPETIAAVYQYCLSGGAAHFMITLPTVSEETMFKGMDAVNEYWKSGGKGLLGLHLEGPYIDPAKKGAHLEQYIQVPTPQKVKELLKRANGAVKMMTIAPQHASKEIIELLKEHQVLISAGHSNTSYEIATEAFENGIPAATHLFNAMSPFESRSPGMVGAIFDHSKVCSSVVADGVHVSFDAIRISKKIMGQRLFLITDAVDENPVGDYVYLRGKDRFVSATGVLSGSCLTMLQAVKNCVTHVGISAHEALKMGSEYPAKLVQRLDLAQLKPGAQANFMIFDESFQLVSMILDGLPKE